MATAVGPQSQGTGAPPPQYITAGRGINVPNPAYQAWLKAGQAQTAAAAAPTKPAATPKPAAAPDYGGAYGPDGRWYPKDKNGQLVGYNPPGYTPPPPGGPSGPTPYQQMTKYEEAQIALQREQLAAQQKQQLAAEKLGASTLIENSNNQYRQDRLKDFYGTLGGRAFDSPKGAPVFQKAPESQTMKDAYALTGEQDPWTAGAAPYAGYTGSSQMNAQHPNLSGPYDNPPVPTSGTGSQIPIPPRSMAMGGMIPQISANGPVPSPPNATSTIQGPPLSYGGGGEIPGSTGQPQLIMAHGGEEITPAPGTPMPTLLGSPGGKPFSNPMDPNDPTTQPQGDGGDIKSVISNLIQAVQAVLARPEFADLQAPIAAPPDGPGGPPPSMATGGIIPSAGVSQSPAGVGVIPNTGANQSPIGSMSPPQPVNQSPAVGQTGVQGMAPQPQSQSNLIHAAPQTIVNGPGVMNHVPYGRSLTGLGGQGAGMTANGTPVPLSGWQLANMDPSSIADYQSYVGSIAGWNPADLKQVGTSTTQPSGMPMLGAPKNFVPIQIQGGPGGG